MATNTQNDEIDLRDLWTTLVKRKLSIITISLITTLCAVLYVSTAKPVYGGEVLIEIGDIILNGEKNNDKPTLIEPIEKPNDLKEAISQVLLSIDDRKKDKLKVESPKQSTKLIKISYEDGDKQVIRQKLQEAVVFILKRHEEKGAFYQKTGAHIRSSAIIGKIDIFTDPLKPKKVLIVVMAMLGGLMMGVVIALFRGFGAPRQEENN